MLVSWNWNCWTLNLKITSIKSLFHKNIICCWQSIIKFFIWVHHHSTCCTGHDRAVKMIYFIGGRNLRSIIYLKGKPQYQQWLTHVLNQEKWLTYLKVTFPSTFIFLKRSITTDTFNTLRARQNGHHFTDNIFKWKLNWKCVNSA